MFLEDRYERVVKAAVNSGVCMHVFNLTWRLAPPVHDSLCRCDLLYWHDDVLYYFCPLWLLCSLHYF